MPQLQARPTIYKGIEMRSRLEAGYAMWLDQRRWNWSYEPRAFGNDSGQYLPDFRIEDVRDLTTGRTGPAYVEVKPSYELDTVALLRRMEIIWDSEPEAHLLIHAPPADGWQVGMVRCLWRFTVNGGGFRHEGWTCWMATCPELRGPTLGTPQPTSDGPWHGEWWKAGADLAPVQ